MAEHSSRGDVQNDTTTQQFAVDKTALILSAHMDELKPFINVVQFLLHQGTIIIVFLGIVFNSVSFIVLTRKQMRRVTPNLYLAVLAVCDSLALLLNFMVGVLRGQHVWINRSFQDSEHLCKAHSVIVELFNLLSVWIIVAFTAERFFMICFPLKARALISRRNTFIVISVVIFSTLAFAFHKFFVSGFEGDSVFGYSACRTSRAIFPGIIYFYVAFNTWFPTTMIAILNTLIIKQVRKTSAKRQEMTSTRSRSDEKVLKILLTVSSTYVFLMLPLGIVQTSELTWSAIAKVSADHENYVNYMKTKITLKWVRAFFFFFYQMNFAINFFLYAFSTAGTKFRATLRRVFGVKGGTVADTTVVEEMENNDKESKVVPETTMAVEVQESGQAGEKDTTQTVGDKSNDEKRVIINEAMNESRS